MWHLPLSPFYFVRHGETDWNNQHRIMGQKDIPLNHRGEEQAHQAGKILAPYDIDCIITSSLVRARKTAEIIQTYRNVPVMHDARLQECCFGELEGQSRAFDKIIQSWKQNSTPLDGESLIEFKRRIQEVMCDVLNNCSKPLVVAHGGVFEQLLDGLGHAGQYIRNGEPYFFRPPEKNKGMWFMHSLLMD